MSGKVMVALSGGVDSAVSALLLARAGREVEAMFMKNWEEDEGACPAEADAADARAVAAHLGIRCHGRNFAAEYWDQVFAHFLAELARGRTPNPDLLCNREIKFGTFVEHAADLGARRIATGHHARILWRDGAPCLARGADPGKDQSYFLHLLSREQLALAEFPVGDLQKSEVRRLAAEAGLPVADKRDSMGICFIGEQNYRPFVSRFLAPDPGDIVDLRGRVLGTHRGLHLYTLGQRGGLGIGGQRGGTGAPWYVIDKDPACKHLVVHQGEHPRLYSRIVRTEAAHWIAGAPPAVRIRVLAKTRYRQPDQEAEVAVADDGSLVVSFAQPQRAVTPGQSLVLYDGEICLGGAVIADSERLG